MNRPCSFGQTNNPLENIFQQQDENNNNNNNNKQQASNDEHLQPQQQQQNYQENVFNYQSNSFQQPFSYEWNQALSGNGLAQKNTSLISDDYIQSIMNQFGIKPLSEESEKQKLPLSTINTNSQQAISAEQTALQKTENSNNADFQRLQELDYKRIQTEESSSDSIIYKGEEVDKILSRYSFQMLQENNDLQKQVENNNNNNNNLQNTPGSLSYSLNDPKSCSDNIPFQSDVIAEQDTSIHFNLKPPLSSYGQVQSFNEKAFGNSSNACQNSNQQGINSYQQGQNQQDVNYYQIGLNYNQQIYSQSNCLNPNQTQINNSISNIHNLHQGMSGVAGSNINVQEYLNLSKSDLFSNNLSGIKLSLMSQGSSATYFPLSVQTASNISGINTQKQIISTNVLPSSTAFNQQQLLSQHQKQQVNTAASHPNQLNNLSGLNLNFQKQSLLGQYNNPTTDQKCQQCILNKQEISFLQIQLKESQEREETQKKMNDQLMSALNQVQEDKSEQHLSVSSIGRSEIIRQHYEKEISQVREQMNTRYKQQETVSKQLVLKFDELDEQKRSLELELKDLKRQIESQNISMNEAVSNLSKKDYQIFQLSEEIKRFQLRTQSNDENKVYNLERIIEQMEINRQQVVLDADKESQKQKIILAQTIEQFENKFKTLIGEKNTIEKSSVSNCENSSDMRQKLNEEIKKLRYQNETAQRQIEQQQKTNEQQKIQGIAQSTLLSQIEEQERTIEHLQGISLAHDALQVQFAQQAANIKHLQLKIKEQAQEFQELKAKRSTYMKMATSKYAELASKLSEHVQNHDKMKKDFQRKSAMIIREILNKDMKIRQLSQKVQILSSNSFSTTNNSHLLTATHNKRDKSPLARLVQEEKTLSDHPNFVEFNKSQLLSPPQQEKTRSATPTNVKNSQYDINERILEELQSRSRSPVSRGTCNTQQFWQNFMDMSNISSDNLLNGLQSLPLIIGEEEEDNLNNVSAGNATNMTQESLKNKYGSLLQQRNVLEETMNDLKLQLNRKNELEICLKNEIRFIVEYLVQTLADQIVLDIRDKENINLQGLQSSSSAQSAFHDSQKVIYVNEEERIMRETDKILKQHIIKLQQKSIQFQMIECFNILNSILGQNTAESKPKQNISEKLPLQPSELKSKSVNKQQQSSQHTEKQQDVVKKSGMQQTNSCKIENQSKCQSPFSQSLFLQKQPQSQKSQIIEHSASTKYLRNTRSTQNKNNTSLNASNTSANSPTKFKKSALKLSDLKVDTNQIKKKQQQSPSPLNKQPQLTPTRAQKMQKFGYFLSKQSVMNASTTKNVLKTSESNLSQNNLSNYNNTNTN